jgi:glycosyltransferase involved in cell wall biosynthesis
MRKNIEELIESNGVASSVKLYESLDNPEMFMAASDVFVAPYRSERFSSVNIIEALAFGLPVIATHIGEQKEIIVNGHNGLLVAPGDNAELSGAMLKIIAQRELHASLAQSARSAAQNYTVSAAVQRLTALYTHLSS